VARIIERETPSLDPQFRVLRARLGALTLHSMYDAKETTSAARSAFLDKFERQVDPNGELSPEERQRRAEFARKAHFTRMAMKSAQARSQAKAAQGEPI